MSSREKWDRIYAARDGAGNPSPFLVGVADLLPQTGAALDVAGGAGRNALWLAARGLEVTVADVSTVGLKLAASAAARAGLPLRTVQRDLEADGLPPGRWDVIVCVSYLWRPLYPQMAGALTPRGVLVVSHPTRSNLERNPKPSARFLLDDGELPGLAGSLEIVRYREGWRDGQHLADLIARRPSR